MGIQATKKPIRQMTEEELGNLLTSKCSGLTKQLAATALEAIRDRQLSASKRIVLVQLSDGTVECFADEGVIAKTVIVKPWERRDETCERELLGHWKELDFPNRSKVMLPPQIVPLVGPLEIVQINDWRARCELAPLVKTLLENGK